MPRTALLATVLGLLVGGALISQQVETPAEAAASSWTDWLPDTVRPVAYANPPVTSDSLSEAEAWSALHDLHQMQAARLAAMQRGDTATTTRLLDEALHTAQTYAERPGFAERDDTRALVHSLQQAYRTHHGVPDSLVLPEGRIYGIRQSLFDAVNDPDAGTTDPPLLEEVLPTGIEHMRTSVPMTINTPVRQSIAFLLRNARLHLYPWMRRTDTYFPMIEHIFAEEDVPDELKYLALVESGMNPFAQSHARAGGLWQFMPSTARQYGLTITPWVDERRDPEKSTRAAARLLRDLHTFFGDWHLALAGYNFRPARVKQLVRQTEQEQGHPATFWDIYDELPQETRNYVPMFIATAAILSDPSAFDLLRVPTGPRYAFDHVPVQHPLPLAQIAEWVDAPVEQLRALNPELRGDRLPDTREPYFVRLPYGSFSQFAEAYDVYRQSEETPDSLYVAVKNGDTAGRLAARHQVDREAMPHRMLSSVHEGTPLSIPPATYSGNVALLADAGALPMRVQYSSRSSRRLSMPGSDEFETGLPGSEDSTLTAPPPPARP